ncbi:hypothetical protein GCM10027180_00020 [Microbulbifer echini]
MDEQSTIYLTIKRSPTPARDQFPELLALIEDGYAKGFHRLAVSVFDHWLSVVSG